jgi:gliding motility-associated-like protein
VLEPTIKNPLVVTPVPTDYEVRATIGGCFATTLIRVNTVPYPVANAGANQSVCYNGTTVLNGTTDGSSWHWEPAQYMNDPRSLNPLVFPPRTTQFVLTSFDTRGCPKPGRDTVEVFVYPKMNVSAGADTAVVIHQPLQLLATGAVSYTWSPPAYLSAVNIADPIALFDEEADNMKYKVVGKSEAGCLDSAWISIRLFKTAPSIFVPTAFTPNQDGRNDLLRPIAAGMSSINYFSIYNRWGQLVFTTTTNGHGWDGRVNGVPQGSGTYVWMARATDYHGNTWFDKGTVTLIR